MHYGPIPIYKLQNQKLRTLPSGTFSLSSAGLCFTAQYGRDLIHLVMQGDKPFTEVDRTLREHEVAVLPPGRLDVTLGAISRLNGAGDWPHGWLGITPENEMMLAIVIAGLGGQTSYALTNLTTGITVQEPDNWQHLVWIREWTLSMVDTDTATRYELARFSAPDRS